MPQFRRSSPTTSCCVLHDARFFRVRCVGEYFSRARRIPHRITQRGQADRTKNRFSASLTVLIPESAKLARQKAACNRGQVDYP